jgi:hypothetical protein
VRLPRDGPSPFCLRKMSFGNRIRVSGNAYYLPNSGVGTFLYRACPHVNGEADSRFCRAPGRLWRIKGEYGSLPMWGRAENAFWLSELRVTCCSKAFGKDRG